MSESFPVRELSLTRLPDGRQQLVLEAGDERRSRVTVAGFLHVRVRTDPRTQGATFDLDLCPSVGGVPRTWGTLSVVPPESFADRDYLGYD